jgi:hybrid cluster-associated redox disulfide protein
MDTTMIDTHLTVEEILEKWPHTFSVFMKNRTKCVGCLMQRFCTLKDVADIHQISLETLIEEIENMSHEEK